MVALNDAASVAAAEQRQIQAVDVIRARRNRLALVRLMLRAPEPFATPF